MRYAIDAESAVDLQHAHEAGEQQPGPDGLDRLIVERDDAAEHGRIAAEAALPKPVRQYRDAAADAALSPAWKSRPRSGSTRSHSKKPGETRAPRRGSGDPPPVTTTPTGCTASARQVTSYPRCQASIDTALAGQPERRLITEAGRTSPAATSPSAS